MVFVEREDERANMEIAFMNYCTYVYSFCTVHAVSNVLYVLYSARPKLLMKTLTTVVCRYVISIL